MEDKKKPEGKEKRRIVEKRKGDGKLGIDEGKWEIGMIKNGRRKVLERMGEKKK
jgi:hypothetical protein